LGAFFCGGAYGYLVSFLVLDLVEANTKEINNILKEERANMQNTQTTHPNYKEV